MPSAALTQWQCDRSARLKEVDAHCTSLQTSGLARTLLEESLRGYVMHLSAHFQGFCRDLYTECSQVVVAAIPPNLQATAQTQFTTLLALEKGNPIYANIKTDFSRFGFVLDLNAVMPDSMQQITKLSHLNTWRNRSAHQGTQTLAGSVPAVLTLSTIQDWRATCDGLSQALDAIMYNELTRILGGAAPW